MSLYAGIDLHANNSYLALIDEADQRLFDKRLPNNLGTIRKALKPFKGRLTGVATESIN